MRWWVRERAGAGLRGITSASATFSAGTYGVLKRFLVGYFYHNDTEEQG